MASLFCDFVLGFTDPDGDGLFSFDDSEFVRCDAPLCSAHAVYQGNVHVSGRAGGTESVDHCIGHQGEDRWGPISPEAAERIRYRHRCTARGLRLITGEPRHHGVS